METLYNSVFGSQEILQDRYVPNIKKYKIKTYSHCILKLHVKTPHFMKAGIADSDPPNNTHM